MPELPEVEHVRSSLESATRGLSVRRVSLKRRDYAHGSRSPRALLSGQTLASFLRRGKQMAIVSDSGAAICLHLGMSGQLTALPPGARPAQADHTHVIWSLAHPDGRPAGRILFRDPRRFGGVWTFPSLDELHTQRWCRLGPDGLEATGADIQARAGSSARAIKAALLDQAVIAGVGNIYADESLFRAGISPFALCRDLETGQFEEIARHIRCVLAEAIEQGGSTIRDYRHTDDQPGAFQHRHRVYGRGGQPCVICGRALDSGSLAQRTTVWCSGCQPGG